MKKNNSKPLTEESISVQSHLQIIQNIIQRMAANSAACKTWSITIVSAILVLVAEKNKPELAWLAFLPSLLFLALDAYYLALEKAFRLAYSQFIKKLHENKLLSADIYSVVPEGNMSRHQLKALASFSIWGFYTVLFILICLAKYFVLN